MKQKQAQTQMLTTFVRQDNTLTDNMPDDFASMCCIGAVLMILDLMAVYQYGIRALLVTAVCVAVCWSADAMCLMLRHRPLHIHDLSAVVTGLTISAMLPASVPYTIAAAASVFAVCAAKHPFGGHGCEIFNCAAVGYIFAELSYPSSVLMYPKPMTELPLSNYIDTVLYSSFSKTSMVADSSMYSDFELVIGSFAGPMGCTFTVLIFVCAMVLISQRAISGIVFFTELSAVLLWKFAQGGISEVKVSLAGGMLLFGIMILSCDNASGLKSKRERFLFGLLSGLLIIAVSEISTLENPVVYAAVIAAPFSRLAGGIGHRESRRKRAEKIFARQAVTGESIEMIGDGHNGE